MEKATHYFRRKPHRNYNDCDDSDGTMCQMSYTDQCVLTVVCKLWSCVSWKFSLKGGGEKEKNKTQCFSDFVTKNVSSFTHNMPQTLASLPVTPLHPPPPPATPILHPTPPPDHHTDNTNLKPVVTVREPFPACLFRMGEDRQMSSASCHQLKGEIKSN